MDKKYTIWDWINAVVFPIAFIILMSGFFIYAAELRLIRFYFTVGLLLSSFSVMHVIIYFKNYIDNRANKKSKFETDIWTLLGLLLIATIYLRLTIYFLPLGIVFN